MSTLALCVVAKNAAELSAWRAVHEDLSIVDELFLVNNDGGRFGGYGYVGERALAASRSVVFGLCHADTAFRGDAFKRFFDAAVVGNVAGMVGRSMDGQYHWSKSGDFHSPTCLDGCAIFFRRDSGLGFDTNQFDGFHCVGEDIALCARTRGIPLVIPNADADHASTSNFPPGGDHSQGHKPWLDSYYGYVDRLKRKYPHLQFHVS